MKTSNGVTRLKCPSDTSKTSFIFTTLEPEYLFRSMSFAFTKAGYGWTLIVDDSSVVFCQSYKCAGNCNINPFVRKRNCTKIVLGNCHVVCTEMKNILTCYFTKRKYLCVILIVTVYAEVPRWFRNPTSYPGRLSQN